MTDDLPQHFSFFTFKTKQNVSKSKLGGEFAKKGWNDFSNGFSEKVQETSFTKGEEPIRKRTKIDPEVFKKQILTEGCKTKQRKPIIEHKDADFFTSKAKDFCSLIQKKSLQAENQKDLKTRNFNKCPNSVFLDIQNIRDSFQQNKSTLQNKFSLKAPNKNLITDLATKTAGGQENIPSKNGCQFSFQDNDFSHSVSIKEVKKTNVISSLAKKNLTIINDLSEPITNSLCSRKNNFGIKSNDCENVPANTRKVQWLDQNQNKNVSFNLSAFLEEESSKSKGSNWLQSLQICDSEVAQEDTDGKRRIRNILPGGFAEQMLKLQRIEKSEEVIWDHNVDRSKKKGKYLSLALISASSTGGIVVAKCLSLSTELSTSGIERDDGVSTESKRVVVLLKKGVFNKLHLKARSVFHLYPPWQTVHLPLISCPVILCAKFIDVDSCEGEDDISYGHSISSSSSTASNQVTLSSCSNEIFHQGAQPVSLSGRIQRIWKVETANESAFPLTSSPNYFRYSLLIQEQNGIFYELVLSSTHFAPHFWKEFISEAEGNCYEFNDLHLVRRVCLKKNPQLSRVLDLLSMPQDDRKGFKQEFCYQLAFHDCPAVPEVVSEEEFPAYCPVSLQPLASLFREMNTLRVTCICKIIFRFRKTLFLCDDSVPKCVQLESLFPVRSKHSLIGSLVLVRDAQWIEGCLFLDNYSSFIQISEESELDERLKRLLRNRLNRLTNVTLRDVVPSINVKSENSTFVFIEGEVIGVDTNNALSWLECNLCWSDNLVQDSRQVIYCENCFQVVPKPVLNLKMSVTCQCSPHVRVEVELLSRTIKRILQINDNTHQPGCSVDDILGKRIGPLVCRIGTSATVGDGKLFRASEVDTS